MLALCSLIGELAAPQFRAMWMAENSTANLHNILTLRGAQVRDALKWAGYLNETIEMFGDKTDVKFQSHHWPIWGTEKVVDYWKKQRDMYKYIHDQSVNLMNKGYTGIEISNMVKLPPELDKAWYNRGYYGTVKHNTRAVYQRYMGFYDGNPSALDQLPPEEAAKKYVGYMGGADALMAKAKTDFDKGEYRWVAQVMKHVVFADANNKAGKELLADAYGRWAIRPSPVHGARSICRALTICATACPVPAASTPPAPT